MTPAIISAQKSQIDFSVHEYSHEAKPHNKNHQGYGIEAAEKLSIAPARVFKTLVIQLDSKKLAVAVVPVTHQLNLKSVAKALKAKRSVMAQPNDVMRSTGYVLGGVSPLGQKKRLATCIDESCLDFDTIYISAGKRGLEIELSAKALIDATGAVMADIKSLT